MSNVDEITQGMDEDQITSGHFPVVQQLSVALGILLLIFGTTYIHSLRGLVTQNANQAESIETRTVSPVREQLSVDDYFKNTSIKAQSAFVWDVQAQRTLYSKNADDQLPLASITKLMTALVAYELLNKDTRLDVSADAVREDGDSGLSSGESFSFRDLTDLTLISSSNDGAHALADGAINSHFDEISGTKLFVEAMNIRAGEIGLTQTFFKNVTGLDLSKTEAGAYGSARDITFLMEYILAHYPDLLTETTASQKMIQNTNGETHLVANTNDVVSKIPGLLASKTGYTELAGGNLIIAFNLGLNHPVIVTVLGSTINGRFEDVEALVSKSQEYILNLE